MRKIGKLVQYLIVFTGMLVLLLILNMIFLFALGYKTRETTPYPNPELLAELLERKDGDGFVMPQEGLDIINANDGFAMVIGNSGDVLWEYKLPKELKQTYTIKDVAVFAKWYLKDYPVDIYVIEEGIFVVGHPKGSMWKYTMRHSISTIKGLVKYLPFLLVTDVILLLVIPFLLLYRKSWRREMERTTWIAGVSHDIRTPLSLVLGYADSIKNESSDVEIAQKAEVIEEQAIRLRTLITNLNTENKLAYGMGKWQKEKILLPALIREIMCDLMNCSMGEQYELKIDIPQELEQLYITGDKELIKRMLENLVNNSIAHNPQGCCISISLKMCQAGPIIWYVLVVSDNGCGADRAQLRKLRAPLRFEKLSEHGIGTRLVRRIAAKHHWKVRFQNNKNGGFCCKIKMRKNFLDKTS